MKVSSILFASLLLLSSLFAEQWGDEPTSEDTQMYSDYDGTMIDGDGSSIQFGDVFESSVKEEGVVDISKLRKRIRFPSSEYGALPLSTSIGKGILNGNIDCGKTRVYLNPVTTYSQDWYDKAYVLGYTLKKPDDRLYKYLRFTSSDKDGNFSFDLVPSGSYYLVGLFKNEDGTKRIAVQTVHIEDGKPVDIVLY